MDSAGTRRSRQFASRVAVAGAVLGLSAGVAAAQALVPGSSAAQAPLVLVAAPANGALIIGDSARFVVRTGAGTVRFQAFLNGTDVSRRFGAAGGGQRVAVFRRAQVLQAGVNNLALTARSRAGRTVWVFRRLVLAQRAPTALRGALFAGVSSSAPLKVTLGTLSFSHPTLQATLNGRRIDRAFGSSSPRQTAMLSRGADHSPEQGPTVR
jgi:hypothetical protein